MRFLRKLLLVHLLIVTSSHAGSVHKAGFTHIDSSYTPRSLIEDDVESLQDTLHHAPKQVQLAQAIVQQAQASQALRNQARYNRPLKNKPQQRPVRAKLQAHGDVISSHIRDAAIVVAEYEARELASSNTSHIPKRGASFWMESISHGTVPIGGSSGYQVRSNHDAKVRTLC
jgi:hypothetical protein